MDITHSLFDLLALASIIFGIGTIFRR